MNHPIARNYTNASRFGGFRPQAMLSKHILLPNGQISCVSCHLGYSKDHGKLVISNQRSALCMECHDL
jgi:predicted CXXCH cytochrome family protein